MVAPLLVVAGGLTILEACSANGDTSPTTVSPVDGGKGGTPPGTPPPGTNPPPSSGDDGGGTDGGSDCGKPAELFPPKAGATDFYCPFAREADGGQIYCPLADTCCETPSGGAAGSCVSGKTTSCPVTGSTAWQCASPSDCGGSMKCCAVAMTGAVTVASDTCGPYLSHFYGTVCAASCAAGQLTVCEVPADCSAGTCTAVKPKGNDIGVCN
ncbi:MAG TPA: hypothetical protein VIF62_20170 [Labilithrix sp.]|jgi:hypothetical protein